MIANIEVIAMVYKSVDYARFIAQQLEETRLTTTTRKCPVVCRIVANDPTAEVQAAITQVSQQHNVTIETYYDKSPSDYYLNRVYRCWNYCVESSRCSHVCLVNSDMLFEEQWLTRLMHKESDMTLPVSMLVESGKLLSGKYAISKNFGRHPNNLQRESWHSYASNMRMLNANLTGPGGLYMPCIFDRARFLMSGGFPEGNIYADGVGTRNGPVIQSGDAWFFDRYCKMHNMQHTTVFDSIVYHIQEGEMDE